MIDQDSLKPTQSLPVDSGEFIPQIVPSRDAVWVLTPSGLARADAATGRITAVIRTGYAPSALSAPALIMDSAGRLWITGSLLTVVIPGHLTAYTVARTPDLISAATDGQAIWVERAPPWSGSRSTLLMQPRRRHRPRNYLRAAGGRAGARLPQS